MEMLKKDDVIKIIISASEMNIEKNILDNVHSEYRIDISFYKRNLKESIIDVSYSISGKAAKNLSLKKELTMNIKNQMNELGVKKYSILETEVDTADGYGRQIIKIDKIKG